MALIQHLTIRPLSPADKTVSLCPHPLYASSAQVAGGNIGYGLSNSLPRTWARRPFVSKLIDEMERAGLTEVYFTIQKQNQASIRVAERCGARPIGSSESRLFYSRSLNVFGASR